MGGNSDPGKTPGLEEEPGRYRTNWNTQVIVAIRNSVSGAKGDDRISMCEIGGGGASSWAGTWLEPGLEGSFCGLMSRLWRVMK